jgi:hypothetical protein
MTDFRALCAELAQQLDDALDFTVSSGTRQFMKTLVTRARAALAEPQPAAATGEPGLQVEPEGPTDDAELRVAYEQGAEERWRDGFPSSWSLSDMERAARTAGLHAVLARWGTPNLAETRSSLEPIPVSERLPEAGDCDADERCWLLVPYWILAPADLTHWLPAHALPLPSDLT